MVHVGVYIGFWAMLGLLGVTTILQSGASYGSFTCVTGEIVKSESQCPQCMVNADCQEPGKLDWQCNYETNKCERKTCFSIVDCQDENTLCEFNKCVQEDVLGDFYRSQLEE